MLYFVGHDLCLFGNLGHIQVTVDWGSPITGLSAKTILQR